jgi:hypothetical protein
MSLCQLWCFVSTLCVHHWRYIDHYEGFTVLLVPGVYQVTVYSWPNTVHLYSQDTFRHVSVGSTTTIFRSDNTTDQKDGHYKLSLSDVCVTWQTHSNSRVLGLWCCLPWRWWWWRPPKHVGMYLVLGQLQTVMGGSSKYQLKLFVCLLSPTLPVQPAVTLLSAGHFRCSQL